MREKNKEEYPTVFSRLEETTGEGSGENRNERGVQLFDYRKGGIRFSNTVLLAHNWLRITQAVIPECFPD